MLEVRSFRGPESIFTLARMGRFAIGVTVWRRGALSLQFNGRFLQVVLGDWWKAMPKTER